MKDEMSGIATAKVTEPAPLPMYEKRIGSTVYRVTVYYSQTSGDTLEDKLMRLMESEVRGNA